MDNPWATAWDHPWHPRDQDTSWSADTTSKWPAIQTTWVQGDSSTSATLEQDITAQDHPSSPVLVASEPRSTTDVSDQQSPCSISPPRHSPDPVPGTTEATSASVSSVSDEASSEVTLNLPDDVWHTEWDTPPSTNPEQTQSADQWEVTRQEKEKLSRAVPAELLDSLLRHCQQVLQETWPAPIVTDDEDNWRSGFDAHADITTLLAQLIPTDLALPPTVQFSATVTARAMNEALKLTRHLPASASSPLSHLLASKGSLEWEKSIKAKQDVVPDIVHVGWRVVEKEERLNSLEESKARKATGGLLSFWNRRASAIQAAPVEITSERSSSPPRSSLESAKSAPHPPSSRAASPSKASTSASLPPPADPRPTVVATAPAPSAVSRFLNRFSRTKGAQHISLALSSDDLEFLSDIVPSASDPLDDTDIALESLRGSSNSSTLPPKIPPPIPPPHKQPILSSLPSSALGLRAPGENTIGNAPRVLQMQTANHTANVPVLDPPLTPKPIASFSYTPSPHPHLSSKDVKTTTVSGQPSTPPTQTNHQPGSQASSRPHSPFTLPPPQKNLPLLSIPPLLPPPPVSPPQTPRPGTFPSITPPGHLSMMKSTDATLFHNTGDSDDEFSAFASFPPSSSAAFPSSSEPYPSQRPPSPPSPPPRRTYERTHYPSSSSTSSTLSPASQTSLEQLYSTKPSVSASLDSFDEFVSPPRVENRERRPSPPPLPAKPQHQQPPRLDTFSSRIYHAHTSSQTFASPTIHTSLMSSAFSVPPVSDAEHQRTQGLVNHAAARGGMLWPNSPDSDEPQLRAIPPPPSSSTPPKPLTREVGFDLLGDGDNLGGLETLPAPLSLVGIPPTTDTFPAPFGAVGGQNKGSGLRNQLQPPVPLLTSTPAPILSFSSLGNLAPLAGASPGPLQPAKPKQTGGLSAQDLSFFEGL